MGPYYPGTMRWDIFCKVIDNYGDIGVCWRLACDLASRGQAVRLFVDDASALAFMAPGGQPGVQVRDWSSGRQATPGDVAIEAFGCELDAPYVDAMAAQARQGQAPAWVNLEYLSAEPYVERCHGLLSPVHSGEGAGLVKRFFYPGFTARTGGLLREHDLSQRQHDFDRQQWLDSLGLAGDAAERISLFCYEPPALPGLLQQLAARPAPTRLLVTPGRAAAAAKAVLDAGLDPGPLAIDWLPPLTQQDYDHLLWACDLNFVRGEDSLVRALWAGKPLVWQIYPQDDGAHAPKLAAFLDWLQAPAELRSFHMAWNGLAAEPLPPLTPASWTAAAEAAKARLLLQDDLATQLIRFVAETR
jgi:uncharacterized repeat protein (TIGR03837 family)